jgi:hypothetical protein
VANVTIARPTYTAPSLARVGRQPALASIAVVAGGSIAFSTLSPPFRMPSAIP